MFNMSKHLDVDSLQVTICLSCVNKLLTFLIYMNWVLVEGQILQTLVMFQAKDLVLMAADPQRPAGLRESSCLPGLKLTEGALNPSLPSLLSHHPLCPSVCFCFTRGNCQPEIPSAVVWGQVTRGQTALQDDWSTTTIRTNSPSKCP